MLDARQESEGWGAAVIPRLARDIRNELPEVKGFSERNIKRMLAFYREYRDLEFVPQAVAQMAGKVKVPQAAALLTADLVLSLPWGHHAVLMEKVKDLAIRRTWHNAKWRFCVADVCGVLTESADAGAYWRKLKPQLLAEGGEAVTNCHDLKLEAQCGKQRVMDCANTKGLLHIIQPIPSPNAEPFKRWLAQVGYERRSSKA